MPYSDTVNVIADTQAANVAIAKTVPERELQSSVIRYAQVLGWRCYHTHDSRRSNPGFPDIVLVRDGRVVYAELKKHGKSPTLEQREWLGDLVSSGQEVYVWRPMDWLGYEIQRLLESKSRPTDEGPTAFENERATKP